jgi:hypothetical protein
MEIVTVQFKEHDGRWINVKVSDDSRVYHALIGAPGKTYDDLRTLYRFKPEDEKTKTYDIDGFVMGTTKE